MPKLTNNTGSEKVLIGIGKIKDGESVNVTEDQAQNFKCDSKFLAQGWKVGEPKKYQIKKKPKKDEGVE